MNKPILSSMNRLLLLLALFTFFGCSATAQVTEKPAETIQISMNATEYVPADQIIFNINITVEDATPRTAFNKHKQMEMLLATTLKKMKLLEHDIRFQPVRISNRYSNNRNQEKYSITNQQVSVSFSDFDLYEELQIALIENGFSSFNANFSSSELDAGKEKALVAAITEAKSKAELIAKTSGVRIAGVKSISYGDYTVTPHSNIQYRMAADDLESAPSMMDFDQTVAISANISIEYYLLD